MAVFDGIDSRNWSHLCGDVLPILADSKVNPLKIEQHKSLKALNTFGLDVFAQHFVSLNNLSSLIEISNVVKEHNQFFILGGGSNVLMTQNFDGLIIHNELKGIEVIKEDSDHVWIKAMAGEVWHDLVLYAVENNFGGIENLSLIPGYVGAAPMQNIGAYGVELKSCFELLEAYHIKKEEVHVFDQEDCGFGYRDSVFKKDLKHQYIILSVTLKLDKKHHVNTTYGAIADTLEQRGINNPTIKDVSDVVIFIRSNKLPHPDKLGNAGSFFKNPVIAHEHIEKIKKTYPDVPLYPVNAQFSKVPAGWLIEQCGWKGKVVGHTGTYKNQALVLVNHGGASGKEILALSQEIQTSVKDKFEISLQPEVNII